MAAVQKEFTCIQCPVGCPLYVEVEGDTVVSVRGNGCARGKQYARSEAVHPERIVTTLVRVAGRERPLSVKTSAPVPKECIREVLAAAKRVVVTPPVNCGDVVVANVANTGADLVATNNLKVLSI